MQQDNSEPTPVVGGDLSSGLELLNRTRTLINDDNTDPLEIGVAKAPEQVSEVQVGTTTTQEKQPTTEAPEKEPEEKQEPSVEEKEKAAKEYKEKFTSDLNEILKESTGVDLNEMTQVLAELLQWRNDILSLEVEQQNKQSLRNPGREPNIPAAVRPGGRDNIQSRNYDFRQSEIDAMDTKTYAKNRQAITNAYLQGRVLKDS